MELGQSSDPPHDAFETRNALLGAVRRSELAFLAGNLQLIECRQGDRLFSPGEEVRSAYFPLDGTTIALSISLADGSDVHASLIGSEGAVGGIVSGGQRPAFARAEVETGGPLVMLAHEQLQEARAASAHLADLFTRYADCLFAQTMQTAACNAFHSAEQRVARWILSLSDRVAAQTIPITQDRLGAIIGAHRVTVLRGLRPIRAARLVDVRRGVVVIRNRVGLEQRACECRAVIEHHYSRMLPGWRTIDRAGQQPAIPAVVSSD
jgi:CRP-like cAMP-binding protein